MTTTAVWEKETSRVRGVPSPISVVAVQNYGISGTLFLQSLLDGHPNILMTPALYSHAFYYFWEAHGERSARDLVELFMRHHANWFTPEGASRDHGLHQMGLGMDEAVFVDAGRFHDALQRIVLGDPAAPCPRKTFFVGTYLAYAEALGKGVKDPAAVVFPIHSLPERHARALFEDFPEGKFLHMVREPVQNIGSTVKHIIHNKLPVNPLECAFAQVACDYTMHWGHGYYAKGDRPFFPDAADRSRAVRLEDFHKNPKATLQALCRWIGIPWDDCLLESTFDGKKWWNRPESPRISGFGTKTIRGDRHNDVTSSFDRARLQGILCRKSAVWGYTAPWEVRAFPFRMLLPLLILFPFRAERYQAKHHHVRRERIEKMASVLRKAIARPKQRLVERWNGFLRLAPETVKELALLDGRRGLRAFFRRAGGKAWLHLAAAALVVRERLIELRMKDALTSGGAEMKDGGGFEDRPPRGAMAFIARASLALRDYVAPRVWLLRGWADSFRRVRPEVRLLETAPGASSSGREPGTVYWITGLSGSGKTTIGREIYRKIARNKTNVIFLDGDDLREALGVKEGYSIEDRRELALTYARLCKLLADQGIDVVCATVSMFHEVREWSRANVRNYKEVYIRVPLPELVARDPKGLYQRALSGEVSNVVGVDLPMEEPESPDVVVENRRGANVPELADELCVRLGIGTDENNAGG